jgi:hypothetical protein
MPDNPDNAICVYDTAGIREGRVQSTGESLSKPGWQIRVRSKGHPVGYARIQAIVSHLDGILQETVAISGNSYIIQAVTQTSTVLALGQEPEGEKRNLFTLNGTITFRVNS